MRQNCSKLRVSAGLFGHLITAPQHQCPQILEGHFDAQRQQDGKSANPGVFLQIEDLREEPELPRRPGDPHVVEEHRKLRQVDGIGDFRP